ncbi:MAG: oligosaccharide flippase family protein [Lachnospiraceae bacterium]|nr:oligosaccharide flippase family protein [Lachnospiraceae bacterium]
MKKGIIQIFLGNLIFLIFGILNNFILPKYLSVDSYALIKTYLLYISYASLLAGGYVEGMFLYYGGKTVEETYHLKFGNNFHTFFWFQGVISLLVFLIGVLLKKYIILLFAIGVFTTNIVSYFKNYSTAVGEFKIYSVSTSIEKILVFIFNAAFIFMFRADNYILYVAVIMVVSIIEIIYFFIKLEGKQKGLFSGNFKLNEITHCMNMGVILLIGNSISALFVGIDQWFVKFLMANTDFALYSFAVSMERIVVIFITPITTVLYNFFCKKNEDSQVAFVRETLVLWGFAILMAVFPLIWVVKTFIPNYADALSVTAILFCGQALNCIINGVYVNVLKAQKRQKQFLIQMIMMTILAIILNIIAYYIVGNIVGLAYATLITKIIWLIICQIECKEYRYSMNVNIALILLIICFIFCSIINNYILGGLLYLLIFLVITMVFMRNSFIKVIIEVKGYVTNLLFNKNKMR